MWIDSNPSLHQAHLERISDFLLPGPGIWWQHTPARIEFFDGYHSPSERPEGPEVHHVRSVSLLDIDIYLHTKCEECCHSQVHLPANHIRQYESDGYLSNIYICQPPCTCATICTDSESPFPCYEQVALQPMSAAQVTSQPMSAVQVTSQPMSAVQVIPQPISAVQVTPQPMSDAQVTPQPMSAAQVTPQQMNDVQVTAQPMNNAQVTPQLISAAQVTPQPMKDAQVTPQLMSAAPQLMSAAQVTPQPMSAAQVTPQPMSAAQVTFKSTLTRTLSEVLPIDSTLKQFDIAIA